MAEPFEVLNPTVETHGTSELSAYLENLVQRQIIPLDIAMVFNNLTSADLQKNAVERYQHKQVPSAWNIVRDLTKTTVPTASAEWKAMIRASWGRPAAWNQAIGMVAACAVIGMVHVIRVETQHAPTPPLTTTVNDHASTTAPPQTNKKLRPQNTPHKLDPHASVPALSSEVSVPSHLQIIKISGKEGLLSWRGVGSGVTYTVYSSTDRLMNTLHKESAGLSVPLYKFSWRTFHRRSTWLAVTATDLSGHEGAFSEVIRVK